MFTGIIEEVGRVKAIESKDRGKGIEIIAHEILTDVELGDSIAVNGICLTVNQLVHQSFTADVMQETLDRTALAKLVPGDRVNLERAMAANGRFGGHIVSGHIDGVGTIRQIRPDGIAQRYSIRANPNILKYVIEKGSIAIDGISLTVTEVTAQTFSVSIIPHTQEQTNLSDRAVGDPVNLEVDIVGKYIEKFINQDKTGPTKMNQDFLQIHGFMA
ncbi:riboflavin synthase [Ignavigranum ruoffiae]|uniref:riboflavin synthase n=1 Tax=Ignavigranum ruoffiae TaxID=89093 RepID=UPI0024ACBFA6|nr:riboflavin synthase [Ignavigranum ruoffiae]